MWTQYLPTAPSTLLEILQWKHSSGNDWGKFAGVVFFMRVMSWEQALTPQAVCLILDCIAVSHHMIWT